MKKTRTLGLITMLVLSWVETPNIRAEINQWTSLGWPEGGAVQNLIIDPKNPNTLYATGSATNLGVGIFKSTNGGANWRSINFGLTSTGVSSLTIVAQNPSTLYAGTWGSGVFKSIDGGESWGTTGLTNTFVNALAIDPQNSRIVYAATMNAGGPSWALYVEGLFKSTDGGMSWTKLSPAYLPQVQLLAIDPRSPNIVYAGEGGCCSNGALYRSPDGGVYWTDVPEMSGCLMTAVLFPLQQANTVFAAASCNVSETFFPSLFKSIDGGTSWSRTLNSGLPTTWSISTLAIDPQNPATLYAGTPDKGVFKSTDGGTNWQTLDPGLRPPSVNALAIDPQNPNRIYIGTGTGVLKTTDAGASWNFANTGLQANAVAALAVDPQDSSTFYAAAQVEWLFNKFTDGLQGAPGRLFKSTDRGATWNSISPPGNAYTSGLTVARDGIVYDCTEALFKSSDAGATWFALPPFPGTLGLGSGANSCVTLASDPQSPSTLYASTRVGIVKSTDGGRSWRTVNSGLPTFRNFSLVYTLAVDPTTPGTVYVVTDAVVGPQPIPYGLFKSTDGGMSWNRLNTPTDTGIRSLVIAPQNPTAIYAATSAALFRSTDDGATWGSVNFGMDASSVFKLAVDPQDPNTLYAGTSRGLFTITFASQSPVLVHNFEFNQASVPIGNSYIARASGVNLTAQTYFDILYRAPGSNVVEEALNWQTGAVAVHTLSAAIALGTWSIVGVRVHENEAEHTGSYAPVSAAVNVLGNVSP